MIGGIYDHDAEKLLVEQRLASSKYIDYIRYIMPK